MKFKSNIEIQAGVEAGGSTGSNGQVLSSTGSGVAWIDQSAVAPASDLVSFNVKNETGSTILKGKGVMAVGTDGNSGHILIDEMIADGSVEPKYFLGVLEENIANGGFARAISFGQLDQFNTSGQNGETWNDGQILWCDPANPGDFTITEPDGPNVKIAAAFILNSSTNGKIQVRVQANEGIHDLHDTKITSQVDGDVLVWDNITGVWFNDSTLNVDYTNSRVGIGTTNPTSTLQVDGQVLISATAPFLDFVDTNSFTDVDDRFRVRAGVNQGLIQWYDASTANTQTIMSLNPNADVDIVGNLTADNFSGSSSGTNTGDQDLSGYLTTTGKAADSNLLDGINSTSFLRSDANDETGSGIKTWFSGAINSGSGATIQVNGFQRTGNIYLHSGGNSPNNTRDSDYLSNINGDLHWNKHDVGNGKVWTSTSDGSGSGLDADLLDGQHASSFQAAGTYNTVIGTDADINTSGATIIDNLYMTDGVITSHGTRNLSAGDIGAAAASHSHPYLPLSGGTLTGKLNFTGSSSGVEVFYNDHASGGIWDTFVYLGKTDNASNHGNVAPIYQQDGSYGLHVQANSDGAFFGIEPTGSGGFAPVIKWGDDSGTGEDLFFRHSDDTYVGKFTHNSFHVDGVINATGGNSTQWNTAYGWGDHAGLYANASHNHDDRYYTETQSEARYVKEGGTSFNGSYPMVVRVSARSFYSNSNISFTGSTNSLSVAGDMRAPSFYDSNNTGYYLNPAGTSNLNNLTVNGTLTGTASGNLPINGKAADSELIDGIDSSRIVYGNGSRKTNNQDPNTAFNSGFYDIYQTNAPTSTWYSYLTMAHTNAGNMHGHQIAGSFYSDGDLFNRHYDGNGSFGNWTRIWNAANDGAGSGLDADLLDGQHASAFQPAGTYNTVIGTDSDINTSGSTIIDNIYVTDGVITSMGTRALTLGDLGYTGATNANYITNNNQLTNGAGYITSSGTVTSLIGLGIIQSTSTGTSYQNNYQIRENSGGGGNTSETYAPQIAFHHSGVVASSIMMEASGRIAIRNNPGTGYENFIASTSYATSSVQAPMFYDSNNTSYYLDPASTSNLNTVTAAQFNGPLSGNATTATTATQSNAVNITGYGNGNFTFYQTSGTFAGYSGWANYFIGSHGNGSNYYNTIHIMPFWGAPKYSRLEGGTQTAVYDYWTSEGVINSNHAVNAPIFYDSNNTSYYIDPSTTGLSAKLNGNIEVYARSAAWAEGVRIRVPTTNTWGGIRWTRDRANYDGNWALGFKGAGDTSDDLVFWANNGGSESDKGRFDKSGNFIVYGSSRAPIFYDSNDTGYYLNPANTSNLWALTVNGGNLNMYKNGTLSSELTFQNSTHKLGIDYQNNETLRFITRSGTTTVPITFQMRAGTITASNFILSSDERKKTKIKGLSRDNIDVNWKSFEMKNNEGEYRVGVIAQELEIKHPEFVNTDNEGFKSVKYIDLLIAKIAELEARLEKAGI